MRERVAKAIWESPEQREKVVGLTTASRLDQVQEGGRELGQQGRELKTKRGPRKCIEN